VSKFWIVTGLNKSILLQILKAIN